MNNDYFFVLDVGNTNIKVGVADEKSLIRSFSLPTVHSDTADSLGLKLLGLLQAVGLDRERFKDAVVCSVVPQVDGLVSGAFESFFGITPKFVPRDIPLSIENKFKYPWEVGADRLVTSYSARKLFEDDIIVVVDFGTATTFDCVQGNAHVGGLICPGVKSSTESLVRRAAKLPKISLEVDQAGLDISTSTVQSLNQGVVYGFAAMVDGLCQRLNQRLGGKALVVATGGFAANMAKVSESIDHVLPDLLLRGLRQLRCAS